jgi:hypothetical protein
MRPSRFNDRHPSSLQPAGRRWGFGAHSVMPYLVHTAQVTDGARADDEGSIRNPVFPKMEEALRALRQGH